MVLLLLGVLGLLGWPSRRGMQQALLVQVALLQVCSVGALQGRRQLCSLQSVVQVRSVVQTMHCCSVCRAGAYTAGLSCTSQQLHEKRVALQQNQCWPGQVSHLGRAPWCSAAGLRVPQAVEAVQAAEVVLGQEQVQPLVQALHHQLQHRTRS